MSQQITPKQALRYSRQINLSSIDLEGQEKLLNSHALVLGLGGLGCAAAQFLVASGVGRIGLIDFDEVELSNLQRQILYTPDDVGKPKVESAARQLSNQNPEVKLEVYFEKADKNLLENLVGEYDVILDCSDNLETRLMLNQVCFQSHTPLVSGAAIRMEGQLMVFTYKANQPCYACVASLFKDPELSCVESGVLSPVVGVIGSIQAVEAIKVITGAGEVMTAKMLQYDGFTGNFMSLGISRNKRCECCGS